MTAGQEQPNDEHQWPNSRPCQACDGTGRLPIPHPDTEYLDHRLVPGNDGKWHIDVMDVERALPCES